MVLAVLVPVLSSLSGPAQAQARPEATPVQEVPATKELMRTLRAGGYVLYLRHTTTDTSKPDAYPLVNFNDCASQRNLNDEGRKLAVAIGRHLRAGGIPVSEVIHSPFCRTRDTARLVTEGAGIALREEPKLAYPSNMTAEEKQPVLEMTRQLLSAPVAPGTNRMLVGHTQNVAELIDHFIKPEGAMAVFRPLGGGRFAYVASIAPNAWAGLLR